MQFREPLIIPCFAFAAGILAARYARFDWPELLLAFGALALVAILSCRVQARCLCLATACCCVIAGIAAAEYHRPGPAPVLDAESGETLLVSGCVVEPLSIQNDRGRFVLEIEPGARANVSFRIDPAAAPPSVPFGSRVEFPARVRPPRNYGNPGAFDYVGYLARRETYWLAWVQTRAEIQNEPVSCVSQPKMALANLRAATLHRLDTLHPDDPSAAGFLRALLLGDDDRLESNTSEEFRRTGTYHAIVISGLHISLVAGSLLWVLRRLFVPLWARLILAGAVAWVYTLIAGGQGPVLRAAIGFTLALVAAATFRKVRILNLLAAVALLFLVIDPGQLFEPSFQLSFAAVAAIGGLVAPILDRTSSVVRESARDLSYVRPSPKITPQISSLRVELRLLAQTLSLTTRLPAAWAMSVVGGSARFLATVADMVLLSAGVQFALMLPSISYFHRVPVTSVLANLFAVPLLNGAVGFGLTGLVTGSTILSSIAAWLVRHAEEAVAYFAAIEPDWRSATPPLGLAIAFAASLILLAVFLRKRPGAAILPGLLSLFLGGWLALHEREPGEKGWLEVSSIDVGQGDSLFIVFPDGETMLVDGGGIPTFKGNPARRMDIGEQVVSPYLWERGLRRIGIVAMTHAHDDHAQGLPAIIRNFHPKELWTGAVPDSAAGPLLDEARRNKAKLVQPRAGDERAFGGATVRILGPSREYIPMKSPKNDDSLVLEIRYGRRRFILTGDAERGAEAELVAYDRLSPVDVLKVGHHGSRSSTMPDMLAAIRPKFAVISVGDGNLYGHPHPDVLTRLEEAHVQTFRTDRSGLTRFRTDGEILQVETNSGNWSR